MLYVLILAGGPGTRLWPLCRNDKPKQFLRFPKDQSLLRQSVERARRLVPDERIYISTRERYAEALFAELPDFPVDHVLLEPYRRDTGPAVALMVSFFMEKDPSATLVVLTADHLITNFVAFTDSLRRGAEVAEKYKASVVFGIPPTRPETAFGYLETGPVVIAEEPVVNELKAFKEKPDAATAESYLKKGNCLWNSGMFVWPVRVVAELFQKHAPEIWRGAEAIKEAGFRAASFASAYAALPSVSVDYAIMEKVERGYVVQATFDWEDVGSWRAFTAYREKDEYGNAAKGPVVTLDSSGCLFEASDKLVAAIGVKDLIVVDTPDAILVCPKDRDQEVKELLRKIEAENLDQFL